MAERRNHVTRFVCIQVVVTEAIRGVANRDCAAIADSTARLFEQLAQQPHAVLERTTILVGAIVQAARQKLGYQVTVTRIDVDDVEAGLTGAQCRLAMPTAQLADIATVHALRLHRVDTCRRRAHA